MAICNTCKGKGTSKCPRCEGTGRRAGGISSILCGGCHGSGVVRCRDCMAGDYGIWEKATEYTKIQPQQVPYELEKEIKYFNDHLEELLERYSNKYIAIKNCEVIAEGDSYGEVSGKVRKSKYRSEKCVLIRKVTKEQPIHFVPFPLS